MIRDFWVKNYLSIRDKQELSFLAKGPASELVTEVSDGVFLYKLGILYGSNASGKSNMLIALNGVFRLLVQPQYDAAEEIHGNIPFVLTKDKPTEMYVSFYADGIRYDYDVTFNDKYIIREVLNYYPNKSKAHSTSVPLLAKMFKPTLSSVRSWNSNRRHKIAFARIP